MFLMKTSVEHLLSKETLTPEDIEKEVDFLQKALGDARKTGEIDIATFLDVGPVTTSMRMIVSMMRHWKPEARYTDVQVRDELRKIHSKVLEVEQKYPGIEEIIESYRKPEKKKSSSMLRRAGKKYVCVRCGRIIHAGEKFYYGGPKILADGQKKNYLYCRRCMPDMEKNFQHSRVKKMFDMVKKHPMFNDELRHLLSTATISEYYRVLRKKGYPILRYRYIGRGSGVGVKKDSNYPRRFIIYYMEGEEEQARRRIMMKYPMRRMYMQRIFNPLFPKNKKRTRKVG